MFSQIFIERPKLAIVISLVMVLAGAICINKLPVAEYPEIAPPKINVEAVYTGASAEVIAETVGIPLENELNGLEDLLYFNSTSNNNGSYSCSITFKSGTNSDIAMVNVQNAIKRAEPKLPSEVTKVGVNVAKRSSDILAMISFLSDGTKLNAIQLCNYVTVNIKDPLARLDGVAAVNILAAKEYSMRVWMDPLRMSAIGITTNEITSAINSQNLQAAAGSIGNENSNDFVEYKVNVLGRLKTAEQFGEIIIRDDGEGNIVRLRDSARIELGAKSYSGEVYLNNQECVGTAIYRLDDSNALDTINRVKTELKKLSKSFPEGVKYQITYDPTEFIRVTMSEIVTTLVVALLLVIAITYLFLQDWRATLIPTLAIPVALMATFPFFLILGYSINVLTMFGLILVIGSLVDDAIVVVENTQSLMEREGLSPREAASKCMHQITGAIIATTLVTVACYVPLAFYGGMVGTIYMQFAVAMCISLCISTVVAMTLSPALCSRIMKVPVPEEKRPKIFAPFNIGLNFTRNIYLAGVKLLARRALLTLILLAAAAFFNWSLFKSIPGSFIPGEDKGAFFCDIQMAPGATLARTREVVEEYSRKMQKLDGVREVLSVSGFSFLNGEAENNGLLIVQLENWDKRKDPALEVNKIMQKAQIEGAKDPAARIICFTPPAIMGLGITGGASFMLSGDGTVNASTLSDTAKQFNMELMKRYPGKVLYSNTGYNADTPQLYFDLDRAKAESLGVPVSTIFSTLQSKLASFYVNDFNLQGYAFNVKIQSDILDRGTIDDINNIEIPNKNGEMVPLNSLGRVSYIVGPRQIQRFNKLISADMKAQGNGISSGELMNLIESVPLPAGYTINWTDMSYQERENQGQIVFLMGLAMLFAYLFLVAQYESWTVPVPVMLSVLFATLGALIGLKLWGEPLSIYAQLGLVMLVGLAAKNAILMVEFSKQERENGVPIFEAAVNGANLRYRAVLMTAWSFIFGVYPLVIATGAGAGSRRAIGIPTFSGMLFATFVGLFFVPALYAACQRAREYVNSKLFRKQ